MEIHERFAKAVAKDEEQRKQREKLRNIIDAAEREVNKTSYEKLATETISLMKEKEKDIILSLATVFLKVDSELTLAKAKIALLENRPEVALEYLGVRKEEL